MFGKIKIFLLCLAFCPWVKLSAQQEGFLSLAMEELLYRTENEAMVEEFSDLFEESLTMKLDLNTCTREQLEKSGLFSPFQVHQLLKYRKQFGSFYSLFELRVIPGFNQSHLQVLEPFLDFQENSESAASISRKHLLLLDMNQSHPASLAYKKNPSGEGNKKYAGAPIQLILRIRSQFGNKLSAGLTYEKDAGETVLYANKAQFVSGYLAYNGEGFMKQLVLGTFKLNHGLGLVNGTSFIHDPAFLKVNQATIAQLRPYASKTEYEYERGAACRMGWKRADLLLWASHTTMDLSPSILQGNPIEEDWWRHQRKTGLHRSSNEIEGRDLGSRFHTGFQFLFRQKELAMGIMTGLGSMTINKYKFPGSADNPKPVISKNASIHGTWLRGKWNVFGELAMEGGLSFAYQMGTTVQFNDFLWATLLMFHYDRGYTGINPSSYPSGKQPKNEQGLAYHLHMEPGRGVQIKTTGEILFYPSPRYGSLVPSAVYNLGLSLQSPGQAKLNWSISLRKKIWSYTPDTGEAGIRAISETSKTRADLRLKHKPYASFEWQSRLVLSYLSGSKLSQPAYAFLQEGKLDLTPALSAKIQLVLFRVKDWENRIYLHQPGFYYSFNFPSYYGEGQKTTFLITLKALKALILSCKVTGINYRNRDTIGSGYDLTRGNKRWETGLQIRLNL